MKKISSLILFLILSLIAVAQNKDYSIGSLSGNITVSDLGNIVFSLPIDNDVLDISLNYSSFNGNGILGEGFQLSNLSSISRTNKNIFFDGITSAIDYSNGDDFVLDGKRLIKKSDGKYQLENDLTAEVTFYINLDLFLLKKDGKTFYYGNSLDSKIKGKNGTVVWNLSKIEDEYKNEISFGYDNLYIKKIKGQLSEIIFEYENRHDIIKQTINAKKYSITQRVKKIIVKYNDRILKTFEILYTDIDKISRINEIKERNYKGECLPPIKFQWDFINKNVDILEPEIPNFAFYDNKNVDFYDQYIICGDYDNDCKDDITLFASENLMLSGNGAVQRNFFAKVHVYKQLEKEKTIKYTHQKEIVLPSDICLGDIGNQTGGFSYIDFDADGIKELVIPGLNIIPDRRQPYFRLFNIGKDYYSLFADNLKVGKELPVYTFSDFDNSSRILPCYIEKDKNTTYNATLFNFEGKKMERFNFDFVLPSSPEKLFSFDVNGNGLNDLIVIYKDGYTIFWNQGGKIDSKIFSNSFKTENNTISDAFITQPLDFDSDGLVDILQIEKESSLIKVAINNGDGTFTKSVVCVINDLKNGCDDNKFGCNIFDFDADGKTDIVLTKLIDKKAVTFWLKSNSEKLEIFRKAVSENEKDALSSNFSVGDFNGDGLLELINYGYDCFNGGGETKFRIYQLNKNNPSSGKIVSVSNAYSTTNINYAFLTDDNIYTKGNNHNYPLLDVIAPLSVVSTVDEINGLTENITKEYQYFNLTANLQGKGILGFDKMICNNLYTQETLTTKINSWNTDFYTPKGITQTTVKDSYTTISETEFEVVSKGGKNYFSYPSRIINTDIYGDKTITENIYNTDYGYLENSKTEFQDGFYKLLKNENFVNVGGIWQPQIVVNEQKISQADKPFIQKKYFEYDTKNGAVIKQIDNYGTEKQIITEYKYNELGNLILEKNHANNTEINITNYEYDNYKLIKTIKNNPQDTIVYEYDELGNTISQTENNLKTCFEYNGWGNVIKTTNPDCTISTISKGWGDSKEKFYYILSEQTASPWQKTWYDVLGRKTMTETVSEGNIAVNAYNYYDKFSNIINTKTFYGETEFNEFFSYDDLNRLIEQTDKNGNITKYSYTKSSVEIDFNGRKTIKTFDILKNVLSVNDGISTINYTYNSACKPVKISVAGADYALEYDEVGNRVSISDPDGGKQLYEYDAFQRLIKQTDAENNETVNYYENGLLKQSTCGGEITSYDYDEYGKILKTQFNNVSTEYSYDKLNRLKSEVYTIEDKKFEYNFTYNKNGLIESKTFPDNTTEFYKYDELGNLNEILLNDLTVWKLKDCSLIKRTSEINGKYLKTETFDKNGFLLSSKLLMDGKKLKEMLYDFDIKTGNLISRSGMLDEPEYFEYDNADRLTKIINGQDITEMEYAENGNIIFKTGLGNYEYFRKRPHALESVDNTDTIIKNPLQETEYTPFNKVKSLTQYFDDTQNSSITFTYDADHTRRKSVRKIVDVDITQYYLPDYEELGGYGIYQKTHYINSPDGLVGVYVTDLLGGKKFEAAFTDHLGSITAFYQDTILKFAATYDAFGNRTITTGTTAVTRGYCGVHQHYPSFDIIDMGGRMYDPIVGRFLSPDPYIQDWENSQNFNRYTYCLNNPLKYTDPSGEFWLTPILISAGIFGIGNLTTHAIARDIKNFGQGVKMFAQGALVGATLGATTQIPGVSNFLASTWNFSKWGFAAIGTATLGSSFIGNVSGKNNEVFSNSLKIIGGLFSLDESNFFRGIWQGISRFTWESFQTNVGLCYSLTRNIGWRVDYVNYLGGATYSVNQNSSKIDGVSIGNYIGININDEISGNFGNYIRTVHNGLFMHEYGHTIQSRHYGLAYLFNIGIPSLFDAKNHRKGPHRERWFEREASAYGRDYFGNYWTTYSIYPTYGF